MRYYGAEPLGLPNYRADWRDARHKAGLLEVAETLLVRAGKDDLPGQVVLFRLGRTLAPKHCGMLTGEGRFIHAQEALGVIEGNLTEGWRRRIAGRYEFPGVLL